MTNHIKYSRKNARTLKQKMPLNKGILFNIFDFKHISQSKRGEQHLHPVRSEHHPL